MNQNAGFHDMRKNDNIRVMSFFIPFMKHLHSALFPEYSPLLMFSLQKVPFSAALCIVRYLRSNG